MSANSEDWKQKYRELALETEEVQAIQHKREATLKQVVSSMTLALEGEEAQLDNELSDLRAAMLDETGQQLSACAQRIDKQVRQRDSVREERANEILQSVQRWLRYLRQSTANEHTDDLVSSCEARAEKLIDAGYELPGLLSDLVDLQTSVNHGVSDTSLMAAEAATDTVSATDSEAQQRLLQTVADELTELLRTLQLTDDDRLQAKELQQSIEKSLTLDELPQILRIIVQLVGRSGSVGAEEFENYLLDLSSQLSEVETFIKDSRSEQENIGQNQRKLDQAVRSNVVHLSETVKSSSDLNELKRAVAGRLQFVVQAMDDFKRDEAARESRLKDRYESLLLKVEQMEQETQQVRAHMEAEKVKASTDALTGLPNRAAYDERMAEDLARWQRYQTHFAVVVGDLDFFKRINDTYGHLAGDKVLRLIAKVVKMKLRNTDFVARYGGEEFVIIMPSTGSNEAFQAVEKIREAVCNSPFNFHGKPVTVSMSFGITEAREGDNAESLFSRADSMLYKAKNNGRNQAVIG